MNSNLTPCIYRGIKYNVLAKLDSLKFYVTVKPCALYYGIEQNRIECII